MRGGETRHRERLSALDASFLFIESATAPSHGGFLSYLDGPVDFDRFKTELALRVDDLPLYRKVVRRVPLNLAHPTWEFDQHFDIGEHIEQIDLGPSATEQQVHDLTLEIMHRPLDMAKPLWSMHVVNGIEGGRAALINTMHHCMVDGASDGIVTETLFANQRDVATETPVWDKVPPRASLVSLLADALVDDAAGLAALLKSAPRSLASTLHAVMSPAFRGALAAIREYRRAPGLRFPFNKPPSGKLNFSRGTFQLAELRGICAMHESTINDVLLSIVTGALQQYAADCGLDTTGKHFKFQMPTNVRLPDQYGRMGNFAAPVPVHVPLDIDDPVARLRAVIDCTSRVKRLRLAQGLSRAIQAIQTLLTPPGLCLVETLYGAPGLRRLEAALGGVPGTNMFVTNLPRPEVPLYVAGRRILTRHVVVPLLPNQSMVGAALTYDQQLEISYTACSSVRPGAETLMHYTIEAFNELAHAGRSGTASPARDRERVPGIG